MVAAFKKMAISNLGFGNGEKLNVQILPRGQEASLQQNSKLRRKPRMSRSLEY
jgi:hypothetical protein